MDKRKEEQIMQWLIAQIPPKDIAKFANVPVDAVYRIRKKLNPIPTEIRRINALHRYGPLVKRIRQPNHKQVRIARKRAGLTQQEATLLISTTKSTNDGWRAYESSPERKWHRAMPIDRWELFLLLTNQHPVWELHERDNPLKEYLEYRLSDQEDSTLSDDSELVSNNDPSDT